MILTAVGILAKHRVIEAGLRNPSTKALAKLARALGVTLSALFENVG